MESIVGAFSSPLYVAWEITHRCNANCIHCYSSSGPSALSDNELSTEEALNVIDQLAEAGLMVLAFSGGEPFLRKDWSRLAGHAADCGLTVNIATNGTSITPHMPEVLKDLGVKSVTVSLDSNKPDAHDQFRRLPGLYKKATRAIALLSEQGVRVVVGFTPTRLNWKDGPEIIRLAHELGAAAVNLSEYVPAGRGTIDLALSPDDLHSMLVEWIRLREEYRNKMAIIWHDCRVGFLVSEEDKRKYVGCGAGRLVGRILPDGTVTPCVFLPTPIGSFRQSSFREMWDNSPLLRVFRERKGHLTGNCGDCEHIQSCGGCRAVAYAYSGGDPLAGDPHCWISAPGSSLIKLPEGEALPC